MRLFRYEDYEVIVEPEAIMLKPFRKIWTRDRNHKDRRLAKLELAFVYFMADPRSDYKVYTDKNERIEQIRLGEGLGKDWKPDDVVMDAVKFYESFKTETQLVLEDISVTLARFREYLRNIDFYKTDGHGKPLYQLNTVVSTMEKIPQLVKALHDAEQAILAEISSDEKVRGSNEKNMFEDA